MKILERKYTHNCQTDFFSSLCENLVNLVNKGRTVPKSLIDMTYENLTTSTSFLYGHSGTQLIVETIPTGNLNFVGNCFDTLYGNKLRKIL